MDVQEHSWFPAGVRGWLWRAPAPSFLLCCPVSHGLMFPAPTSDGADGVGWLALNRPTRLSLPLRLPVRAVWLWLCCCTPSRPSLTPSLNPSLPPSHTPSLLPPTSQFLWPPALPRLQPPQVPAPPALPPARAAACVRPLLRPAAPAAAAAGGLRGGLHAACGARRHGRHRREGLGEQPRGVAHGG